jgi:hypothetical protein
VLLEHHHVEVADRIDQVEIRARPPAGTPECLPRAWVQRHHYRNVTGKTHKRVEYCQQAPRIVGIFRPVYGGEDITATIQP